MNKAILGKKLGMTQVFLDSGIVVPVTVVQAGPVYVTQIKTVETDGYNAIVVAFEDRKENLVNKPNLGQFKKAEISAKKTLREFRFDDISSYHVGQEIKCDVFSENDVVDVIGTSKGHGFTGMLMRWNAHHQRNTHGGNKVHRSVGSQGAGTGVAKVFKGKHMPGQWGVERKTVQNLSVVKVDAERNIILVKGAIPGAKGALVFVKNAVKA
ncbi:MAG: 50S ribosomal protein L3 [Bacilli bacterium]